MSQMVFCSPTRRVAAAIAFVVGLVLMPSGSPALASRTEASSSTVTAPVAYSQAALASGRVVGLSRDSCGATGMVLSALSDDRGSTWRAGQCVPDGLGVMPDTDGVTVSYLASSGGHGLQVLDANGGVSAVWGGAQFDAGNSSGIDGSTAYVWTFGVGGIFALSPVGAKPCGATLGISAQQGPTIAAIGPLVVVAGLDTAFDWEIVVSTDSCATFTVLPRPAGDRCVSVTVEPDGNILCMRQPDSERFDPSNPSAGWTPFALPDVIGLEAPFALVRDGLEFRWLDTASTGWDPWTWPAPVSVPGAIPDSATPPSGAFAAALTLLNTRFRRPMGLPDVVWQPQIALAAQRHADYWVKNGTGTGLEPHDETPGKPGYEGRNPDARCAAAGYPASDSCGEVAFPGALTPAQAVAGWLGTPFHGLPLLTSAHIGIGDSSAGVVGDLDANNGTPTNVAAGVNVFDYDAPPNTPTATEHAWPFDGDTDVATRWSGGEVPDPLFGYTGDRSNVGPPLFYQSLNPVSVTLLTASGSIVPLITPYTGSPPTTRGSVPSVTSQGGFFAWAAFPARALTAGARYTLVFSPELPGLPERRFTFTTATPTNNAPGPATKKPTRGSILRTRISGCTERLTSRLRNSGTRVAFHFQSIGCTPQFLQVNHAGTWHRAPGKTFIIHAGTSAHWRVLYRRRVIAAGRLSA